MCPTEVTLRCRKKARRWIEKPPCSEHDCPPAIANSLFPIFRPLLSGWNLNSDWYENILQLVLLHHPCLVFHSFGSKPSPSTHWLGTLLVACLPTPRRPRNRHSTYIARADHGRMGGNWRVGRNVDKLHFNRQADCGLCPGRMCGAHCLLRF